MFQGILGPGQFLLNVSSRHSGLCSLDITQAQENDPSVSHNNGNVVVCRVVVIKAALHYKVDVSIRQILGRWDSPSIYGTKDSRLWGS